MYLSILAKLRDTGWGKELDFLGAEGIENMSDMPVVRQPAKLTPGAWLKVRASLDCFLKATRAKRLDTEFRAVLRARFELLEEAITAHYVTLPRTAHMDCRPKYIDFALTPECRAIADVAESETVTTAQFAAVVPALAAKWDADRRRELTAYLLPLLGHVAPDVDPLALAIALFKTSWRRSELMRYPAILAYGCGEGDCFRTRSCSTEEFYADDLYTRTTKTLHWTEADFKTLAHVDEYAAMYVPFNIEELAEPIEAREVVDTMRLVVAALGLDPARATFDELERCEVWLRCSSCETRYRSEEINAMSWSAAYAHAKWDVSRKRPTAWRYADDEDMAKVCALHEAQFEKAYTGAAVRWSCALCPRFDANAAAMTVHLEEA
ncbi:hypothetical protein TRAPUB_9752 [Trametes pubescens]|uniref:Uncharacterized protein n=1 Tax=Trametes pubescens TaxID=154538 RepID=A0A1M2W1H9_TRAPU|nr:hypothetical protein TRAPUB_9752 [Trametes pubescens]